MLLLLFRPGNVITIGLDADELKRRRDAIRKKKEEEERQQALLEEEKYFANKRDFLYE